MSIGDPAANGTAGAAEQVKETAGQLVDQAKDQAKPALQNQKERAAGTLGTTAGALRQTGQQLREQDQGTIAQYMDQAAERLEGFGGYLRGHDLDELVGDAEQFARRQPGLFIGGAFALGLLAARFLKSSSQRADAAARGHSTGSAGSRTAAYCYEPSSAAPMQAATALTPSEAAP